MKFLILLPFILGTAFCTFHSKSGHCECEKQTEDHSKWPLNFFGKAHAAITGIQTVDNPSGHMHFHPAYQHSGLIGHHGSMAAYPVFPNIHLPGLKEESLSVTEHHSKPSKEELVSINAGFVVPGLGLGHHHQSGMHGGFSLLHQKESNGHHQWKLPGLHHSGSHGGSAVFTGHELQPVKEETVSIETEVVSPGSGHLHQSGLGEYSGIAHHQLKPVVEETVEKVSVQTTHQEPFSSYHHHQPVQEETISTIKTEHVSPIHQTSYPLEIAAAFETSGTGIEVAGHRRHFSPIVEGNIKDIFVEEQHPQLGKTVTKTKTVTSLGNEGNIYGQFPYLTKITEHKGVGAFPNFGETGQSSFQIGTGMTNEGIGYKNQQVGEGYGGSYDKGHVHPLGGKIVTKETTISGQGSVLGQLPYSTGHQGISGFGQLSYQAGTGVNKGTLYQNLQLGEGYGGSYDIGHVHPLGGKIVTKETTISDQGNVLGQLPYSTGHQGIGGTGQLSYQAGTGVNKGLLYQNLQLGGGHGGSYGITGIHPVGEKFVTKETSISGQGNVLGQLGSYHNLNKQPLSGIGLQNTQLLNSYQYPVPGYYNSYGKFIPWMYHYGLYSNQGGSNGQYPILTGGYGSLALNSRFKGGEEEVKDKDGTISVSSRFKESGSEEIKEAEDDNAHVEAEKEHIETEVVHDRGSDVGTKVEVEHVVEEGLVFPEKTKVKEYVSEIAQRHGVSEKEVMNPSSVQHFDIPEINSDPDESSLKQTKEETKVIQDGQTISFTIKLPPKTITTKTVVESEGVSEYGVNAEGAEGLITRTETLEMSGPQGYNTHQSGPEELFGNILKGAQVTIEGSKDVSKNDPSHHLNLDPIMNIISDKVLEHSGHTA